MMPFTIKLEEFEAKLQTFIEGKLSGLSLIRGGFSGLSHELVSSMRAGTISLDDGILLAPDRYTLLVHPSNEEAMGEDPMILTAMADVIQTAGNEAGFHFGQHPVVTVSTNEDVQDDRIEIIARISENAMAQTMSLNSATPTGKNLLPQNAFLIKNGMDIFPLDKTVINIGRGSINHLVIKDPRVSRQHVQIRALNGHYEIFDLDSTGGTFINQNRVNHSQLHPGDVISLAGVSLIYGQDRSSSLKDTEKLAPSNKNQPDQ